MEQKNDTRKLKEKLFYNASNVYDSMEEKEFDEMEGLSGRYISFLTEAKTEREAVSYAIRRAKEQGYKEYTFGSEMKAGDKFYFNNRGKSIYLFRIGSEAIENGIRITAAHIDSPRVDLKQHPLYEDGNMGFFKTHYYGGIKKYQWTTVPLALHGVVVKKTAQPSKSKLARTPAILSFISMTCCLIWHRNR